MPPDDISYVRDLGLITTRGEIRIANRIYQEVIPRELIWSTQATIVQEPWWYATSDGRLDMTKLLATFQQFFRENSEHWVERFDYKEAGPQLCQQACKSGSPAISMILSGMILNERDSRP